MVLKDLVVVEGVNARLVLKDMFVFLEDLASLEINVEVRGVKNIIFSTDDCGDENDLKDLFVVNDVASKRVLEDLLASLEMNVRGVKNIITDDWCYDDDDENDGNSDFGAKMKMKVKIEKRIFV